MGGKPKNVQNQPNSKKELSPKADVFRLYEKCHCYIFFKIFYKAPKPSTLVENNQTS